MSSNNVYRDMQAKFRKVLIHHKLTQVGDGMSNDKMRSKFETAILKVAAWMTFERDPDNSDLYQDTEVHCAWMGWKAAMSQSEPAQVSQDTCGSCVNFTGESCKTAFEGHERYSDSASCDEFEAEPAQVSQEPIAVMWQHEETGNTGFVDMSQVENRFFKHNPRLKQVCFLYSSPPDYEALKENAKLLADMLSKVIEERNNLEQRMHELKLRVADLEESNINRHYMYRIGALTAANAELQSERDALKIAYPRRESIIFPANQLTSEPKDDLP